MINKTPAVGRILVLESPMLNGFAARGGEITKLSKSRVYYLRKGRDYGDGGPAEPDVEKFVTNFVAVCDTPEEAQQLLDYSNACLEEVHLLKKKHYRVWRELIGSPLPPEKTNG